MALYGSLQLSHCLGLCRNQGCSKTDKSVIIRTRLHQSDGSLSLRVSARLRRHPISALLQHNSWNIFVSDYLHKPISSVPYRTVSLRCHSFSGVDTMIEPAVKAATLALTKSYNVTQNFPLVYKLVPPVSLLIFSLRGLAPLVRHIRNLLLNKSDKSWKKSSAYHIMISYIQPLLLWLAVLFICRALDPIVLSTEASRVVKDQVLSFVRSLSTVLAFAYCFSNLIQQTQKFFTETSNSNDTRNMGFQFAGKAVYSAVWVAAVSLFMELLGFSTQKLLTAGGLGTVLITLSGREILTNFLSSVMIHATRPFVSNERIQIRIGGYDVSGTVEHIGWWSPTIIRGDHREAIHIPNHKFTVNVVRNITQKTHWRIKTHIAISHFDVNKINTIIADMRKVLANNPQVEQQKLHRRVFLDNVDPENQALLILISCFVKTSRRDEFVAVKEAVLLDLLEVVSHHRAHLATPIRTIRKMYVDDDDDVEYMPFEDAVYGQGGAASRQPLLLTEPSYRTSGEDKPKSRSKSSGTKTKEVAEKPISDEADVKVRTKTTGGDKGKSKGSSSIKPLKHDKSERAEGLPLVSRSTMEENIVLGVALQGSKRTLPMEEGMRSPSAKAANAKELTGAHKNGNKKNNDGHGQAK